MNVLVTGATGFIGRAIIDELPANNIEIISLTSSLKKAETLFKRNAGEVIIADITSEKSLFTLEKLKNIDAVIHSAGLAHQFGDTKKAAFDAVNVEGTRNVTNLAVALKAKQFILISSTAIYESQDTGGKLRAENLQDKKFTPVDEDFPLKPQTLYAQSKLEAEKICVEICEKNNLPLTIFRLAPVIGEANVGNVARLIETIDRNRFFWIGRGENYKSLIYKSDVAKACIEVLKKKTGATEIFNLAAKPVQMKLFVEEIAEKLGRTPYKFHIRENLPRKIFLLNSKLIKNKKIAKIGETIEKWLADDVYSAEKIKARYNFEPTTSITEGLERQIEWYRANRAS